MKLNKTLPALISILSLVSAAHAELRVWSDETGKKIEAEHVRTTNDKVVLKKADGTEIKVSLDTLSERDRKYAILQTPPRIEISVSADADRSNTGYGGRRGIQVQEETVSVKIKIKKSSSSPYEAPLMSEVYLIGQLEQADHYIILEQARSKFSFAEKNEYVFESKKISLKQMEAGKQLGVEYSGYLAIVRDKSGTILETKANKLDFKNNAEAIIGSVRGTAFDKDFNPLEPKKAVMENKPQRRNSLPGRRF